MNARRLMIIEYFVFAAVALLTVAINPPFARFPDQDFLWLDLSVLRGVAWASDALKHSPFSAVDFLQGLGVEVRYDTKTIVHFFDPAVILGLLFDHMTAITLQGFALAFYCLFTLSKLYRQQLPQGSRPGALYYPILLGYVLCPPFFGMVSHSFSPIFYTLPGVILGLRCFAKKPTCGSALAYIGASTLFVSLSDLNIAFIIPPLLFFAWWFDGEIRRQAPSRVLCCVLALGMIVAGDYWCTAQIILGMHGSTAARVGSWELPFYAKEFLLPTLKGLFYPSFGYPHFSYIAPLLPLILIPLVLGKKKGLIARRIGLLMLLISALFALGVIGHGIEPLRRRLPSAMRYHLAIIPFLCSLFLIYSREAIENCFVEVTRRWLTFSITLTSLVAVSFIISELGSVGDTWVLNEWLNPRGFVSWRFALIVMVVLWPLGLFTIVSAFSRFNFSSAVSGFLCVFAAVVITSGYYLMEMCGLPFFSYVDHSLQATLYEKVPIEIDRIIETSEYARVTRSVIPMARGVYSPDRGRNDKLLPLIEYPESYGGRSFFHYRYSLSSHTANYYTHVAGVGYFAFPPTPDRLDKTIEFAYETDSPFIISADAEIADARVEKLGNIPIPPHFLISKRPDLNPGLTGKIGVYALRSFRPNLADHAPKALYFRTYAKFRDVRAGDKLPITHFDSLRAHDENGRMVLLSKRTDGFSQVAEGMSAKMLTVTSFSFLGLFSLISPVAAWSILYLGVLRRAR